jgi:hypothetical protein
MWKKLNFQSVSSQMKGQGQTPTEEWVRFVEGFDFFGLIAKWPEIVGEMMSRESIPLRLKSKTLFILTRHPAFAEKLKFMDRLLIAKIGQIFPEAKPMIHRLAFESNEAFFQEKIQAFTKEKTPGLHPFSPEYKRLRVEAEKLFGQIESTEEKERWISLYIQAAQTKDT